MATNKTQGSRRTALYEKVKASAEPLVKDDPLGSLGDEHAGVRLQDLGKLEPRQDSTWDLSSTDDWSWEAWGRRSEENWIKVAQTMETSVWVAMGAMLGIFVAGFPGTLIYGWAFFVWQPLGAAVGALTALALVKKNQKPYRPSYRIRKPH